MLPDAITIKIDGQRVERFARTPDIEEVTRVTDAIKARYSLGWVGVAALKVRNLNDSLPERSRHNYVRMSR